MHLYPSIYRHAISLSISCRTRPPSCTYGRGRERARASRDAKATRSSGTTRQWNDQFTRSSRPVRYLACGALTCAPSARLHLTPKTLLANRASNVGSPPLRETEGKRHECGREKSELIRSSQRARAIAVASQERHAPSGYLSNQRPRRQHACRARSMPRRQGGRCATRQLRTQKRILARELTDSRHQLLRIHQAFALVPVDIIGAQPRAAAPRTVHLLPLHVALTQMPARVANSAQRSRVFGMQGIRFAR